MKRNKPFTVSIFGRGRLLGLVVADGMKAFPKSMWYDYSARMKEGVALEQSVAQTGYMTAAGVRNARLAVENQARPRKTDVVLHFATDGQIDRVKITVGRKFANIVFDERTSVLADPYYDTSKLIVKAIGRMLG